MCYEIARNFYLMNIHKSANEVFTEKTNLILKCNMPILLWHKSFDFLLKSQGDMLNKYLNSEEKVMKRIYF